MNLFSLMLDNSELCVFENYLLQLSRFSTLIWQVTGVLLISHGYHVCD